MDTQVLYVRFSYELAYLVGYPAYAKLQAASVFKLSHDMLGNLYFFRTCSNFGNLGKRPCFILNYECSFRYMNALVFSAVYYRHVGIHFQYNVVCTLFEFGTGCCGDTQIEISMLIHGCNRQTGSINFLVLVCEHVYKLA